MGGRMSPGVRVQTGGERGLAAGPGLATFPLGWRPRFLLAVPSRHPGLVGGPPQANDRSLTRDGDFLCLVLSIHNDGC